MSDQTLSLGCYSIRSGWLHASKLTRVSIMPLIIKRDSNMEGVPNTTELSDTENRPLFLNVAELADSRPKSIDLAASRASLR